MNLDGSPPRRRRAEPSEDGANPFGIGHIAGCIGPLSAEKPHVFGVDLAKSVDFTVVVGLDEQRRPCIFDRWQHVPWESTVQRILSLIGDKPTLVDSTGVGDPIVETLSAKAPWIEGFKFTSNSKQQLMEGLCLSIQQREVGVLDGPMRLELEAFEYEQTRTGVRYAAPEGMRPEPAEPVTDIHAYFNKMREDPDWGFESTPRRRWN